MDSRKRNNHQKPSAEVTKPMSYDNVCDAMQKMRADIVEQVDQRLSDIFDKAVRTTAERTDTSLRHNDNGHLENRKKSERPGGLPDKLFLPRNSLLTDLFAIDHGRAIYNIFVAILTILFINSALDDVMAGKLNLGLGFIKWSFGELQTASVIWLSMAASTFAVYGGFHVWSTRRARLTPRPQHLKTWDYFWLVALVLYQACFFYFPARGVARGKLPPATAVAVLMEQVRMVMKSHAFVRSNVPRTLASNACPPFERFLYFFFCPTLVYRDAYPRTKNVRWRFVAWNALQLVGVVFFTCFLFERYLVPSHRHYGKTSATHEDRIALVFGAMLPAMMALMCGFYCLLHAWLNVTAEVLRFADRMFYKDWWNAKSYGSYHRKWNVVVHDWLYTYIYKDMCEILGPGKRFVPMLAVFTVSAIVHEYVLAFTFGFFYPVLLITFGLLGLCLVMVTSDQHRGGNVFVLLTQPIGTGLMASLYLMEWYSRVNCVQTRDDISDFFVPRSWFCVPNQRG